MQLDMTLRIVAAAVGLAAIVAGHGPLLAMLERRTGQAEAEKIVECEFTLGQRASREPSLLKSLGRDATVAAPVCANGAVFRAMIDIDNSESWLTVADATAAGIKAGTLVYDFRIATGSGTLDAAMTVLPFVQIGGIRLEDVSIAVVRDEAVPFSVIGTSVLKRLQRVEMTSKGLLLQP